MLLAKLGKRRNGFDTLRYRDKKGSTAAIDYKLSVYKDKKLVADPIKYLNSIYSNAWQNRIFVPWACDFCPDVFAEEADASFMDAWLPEYTQDPNGTSLVISRSPDIAEMLEEIREKKEAHIWPISPQKIIDSQRGVIRHKRYLMPQKLYDATSRRKLVPPRLKKFAQQGTGEQIKENKRYRRLGITALKIWQLPLQEIADCFY